MSVYKMGIDEDDGLFYEVQTTARIMPQDVDDIMCTAIESPCGSWWTKATPPSGWREKHPDVHYAHALITKGESLRFCWLDDENDPDSEEGESINLQDVLDGIQKAADHMKQDVTTFIDSHDAIGADLVIQFAVFDEIIFG